MTARRSRTRRLPAALTLAAVAATACGRDRVASGGPPSGPKNLVLVVVDTVRQDHLRAYGYPRETAPTLSRLAAEGALADGLSPTSWTKPAVASVITGLHPLRHQAIGLGDSLPEAALTLAERLRAEGYHAVGITANGFSGHDHGMGQGFDELVYLADHGHGPFGSAEALNAEALKRLGSLRPPFFLFLHYLDPHAPYEAPAWGGGDQGTVRIQDLDMQTFRSRPAELLQTSIDNYDAEIRRADAALGAVLDALSRRGLMQTTLTLVTSDHGEEFEEHGRTGHGQTLYEELVRVPLVFHWPGVIPPGVRHGSVSLIDVLPTVLDLLGVDFDAAGLDGVSVASFLRAGRGYEPGAREQLLHLDVADSHYLALHDGRRKLVIGRFPHRKQAFDLAADPGERTNLLGQAPGASGLTHRLAELHNELRSRALVRVRTATERRDTLAALGYVAPPRREERGIPERIGPAELDPGAALGWEEPRSFKPCLDLASPGADAQLLEGWYGPEKDGRWTWPTAEAMVVLPAGQRGPTLTLSGVRRERSPAWLRVSVDLRPVFEGPLPSGSFRLALPLERRTRRDIARVRIDREPGYVPAERGALDGRQASPDHRQLGVFLTSVCVTPTPGRAAPGQGAGGRLW